MSSLYYFQVGAQFYFDYAESHIDAQGWFGKDPNPSFKNNKTKLFLANNDQQIVGRIVGIIPEKYNN